MIHRVLFAAIIAGLIGGVFVSFAQMVKVEPLILQAEEYEAVEEPEVASVQAAGAATAADTASEHSHGGGAAAGDGHHDAEAWGPDDGLERRLFTVGSNIITGVGFALLLCAGIVLRGREVDYKTGILWGLSGFLVFSLLPAIGLPPELPGVEAAGVESRQAWWFLTVGCSAIGLALIIFKEAWAFRVLGIVFIIAPHAIGAPHPAEFGGNVPPAMAAQFAVVSLVTTALFWVVVGGVSGYVFQRQQAADPV
ncbi:CbtA family protein [Kiloniella sp.]|uniref:CbtA family protein n=1 Tax=Kiloniella sp. TaxID=1938587 RepID=UPI003B02C494